jgi:hypothetical protein
MSHIVSRRKLRVGQEHELLQKLEDAGLNNPVLADRVISSKNNEIAKQMVGVVRSDGKSKIITPNFMTPRDCDDETVKQLERWQKVYKHFFDIDTNFSGLKIPFALRERTRLVVELNDMKIEQILKAHIANGIKVWRWTDDNLDKLANSNERSGFHAVRVLDGVDSDEAWKNLPADFFQEEGLTTETLIERLLHGLDFFYEKEEHLDQKTGTIGAGSRYAGGRVPRVGWGGGRVCVCRVSPDDHDGDGRVRRVVSVQ